MNLVNRWIEEERKVAAAGTTVNLIGVVDSDSRDTEFYISYQPQNYWYLVTCRPTLGDTEALCSSKNLTDPQRSLARLAPVEAKPGPEAAAAPTDAAAGTANVLSSTTLDELKPMLVEAGFDPVLKQDPTGDYFAIAQGSAVFFVTPFDCDAAKRCTTIQFLSSSYVSTKALSLDDLNSWNRDVGGGWTTGYLGKTGKYSCWASFSITGGVTKDWIVSTSKIFQEMNRRFLSFVTAS